MIMRTGQTVYQKQLQQGAAVVMLPPPLGAVSLPETERNNETVGIMQLVGVKGIF